MSHDKHELLWYARRAGVTAFALMLGALIFGGFAGPSASGSPSKDKEFTQVYQHTYDEVFQASLEAIERMGYFVTAKDKEKGTISGNGIFNVMGSMGPVGKKSTFDIYIETLNTKPETRVTINATVKGVIGGGASNTLKQQLSSEVQRVLATYH
jgi:hypothetical protein